jgi:hypothetical protein
VPTRGARPSAVPTDRIASIDPIDPAQVLPVPRRREPAGDPVVRVEIGRIELRAPPREPERVERSIPKPEAFVSLKQYLRERGGS